MNLKETDLHEPIKNWLELQNCVVRSEVMSIDMMGLYQENFIIAIELKLKLNLEVINQAVERQSIADLVYIAVAHDFKAVETKRYKMTLLTLKRLNLGLLLVNFRATEPIVYEVLKPENFDFERSRKLKGNKRAQIIKEFNKRHGDFNKAGSSKSKLMTGYKEQCLMIAHYMKCYDLSRTKDFIPYGIPTKAASNIFRSNFYNWFTRIDKGVYALSEMGYQALDEYNSVLEYLIKTSEAMHETGQQ